MPKKVENEDEHLPAVNDAAIEEALAPYGMNQAYSLDLRVQQGKWLLRQEVGIRFALGCVLLEINARENFQTFGKVVSDEFGLAKSAAYNYMAFAKKCMDLPKLKTFAEENWSKAVALLDSCTDEELKEIEDKGLNGKVLGEYDGLSVREFKQLLKDREKEFQEADHRIHTQYKGRIEALRDAVPHPDDDSWAAKPLARIEEHLMRLMNELNAFAFNPLIVGNGNIKAKIEGTYQIGYRAFTEFIHKWDFWQHESTFGVKYLLSKKYRRDAELRGYTMSMYWLS
ncbi:MAG: hypothetical protein HGA78_09570 [Nitrospirales bacterium]|nr:hypothetical protein [Nitrospirales bacterium]